MHDERKKKKEREKVRERTVIETIQKWHRNMSHEMSLFKLKGHVYPLRNVMTLISIQI